MIASSLKILLSALCISVCVGNGAALAQDYPNRPIKVIVPFPAGSGTDTATRYILSKVAASFGGTFVVDNRPGANGMIGATEVARSKPDGYTLLFTANSTHASNANLYKELPYDPVKDFAPITRLTLNPIMLVVRSELPIRDMNEFVAYAKANPGKMNYGVGGAGPLAASFLLQSMAGIDIVQVSYKGSPPMLVDLLAGRLDFAFIDPFLVQQHIAKGVLRPLGVATKSRLKGMYPDLLPLNEAGIPGYELDGWTAAFAPAGTPRPVIEKLNGAITEVLKRPEVQAHLQANGMEATPSTPEQLAQYVLDQTEKWRRILEGAGYKKE